MAEELPNPNDIAPETTLNAGVINPLSLRPIELDLPEPPKNYPPMVIPSTMIPTQKATPNQSLQGAQALLNMSSNAGSWAKNPFHYNKEKSYNADYDGANFKRYAEVPRLMREYGFTPYRDNEKLYNEHATNWEYFKRSAGQSWELMKTGFSEMLPWNAWDGEEVDIEAAREMERAHAIGHDSRNGFGAWVNNMTVDSGYTFGILAEFAAEEIVGWVGATLLAPESGGASWAAMAAETGNAVNKMRKLWSLGDKVKDMYKGVSRTYDWIRSADKMRDMYNLGKSGVSWTAKQLTPEMMKWGSDMVKGGFSMKGGEMMIDMAKASKGFGAFYRDARAYAAIVSEAKLEGGSTELQVRDKLIDEYVASHNGEMPNADELTRIYRVASEAGQSTFWWNVPALYISNKIVFDKALKGFKPMSAFREELEVGLKGKLAYNEAWKQAGTKAWEVVDDGFRSTLKSLTKASTYAPKNLLKNGIGTFVNYSKANLTEGLQEMYQDAVQNTMLDYYSDRYYHPSIEGSRSVLGSFVQNAGETFTSKQGWETFASGFFMGGMVQMPQKLAFEWAPKAWWKIKDPEGYTKYMSDLEEHTNSVVNALNAATMDDKFWDSITENTAQQLNNKIQAEKANAAGDKKAYYDIIDEDVFNHMHTLLKSGKISLIKDHLKDLKQLDKKSLQEAFGPVDESEGDAMEVYQKRLDSMLRRADSVEKHYQAVEKRFPNPFDPSRYNSKKNPEAYSNELKAYQAFEQAKKAAMYSNYAFERSVERMKSVMDDLNRNKPVGEAAASDFTTILNKQNLDAEVSILENEIRTFRQGDSESKSKADKLQKKLDHLKDYQDAVDQYQEALRVASKDKSKISDQEVETAKKAAKITKGTRVKNKKGKEAVVAKVRKGIAYDRDGNRIGSLKTLQAISGERESEMLDAATEDLYEKYHAYLKFIASDKGTFATNDDIMSSFQKVKDYYSLNQDALDMSDAVDTLHNPAKLAEYASRVAQVYDEAKKQHKSKIENSYKRFLRMRKMNDLFNQLYNIGVFLDEKGMQDILENKMPDTFFDIATKQVIFETDPKWQQIKDLFASFNATTTEPIKEVKVEEKTEQTQEKKEGAPTSILTLSSSVDQFREAGVLDPIIKAYREFVALQNSATAEGWIDKFALEKSDDQIAYSDAFKQYLQMSPGAVNSILREYNQQVQPKTPGIDLGTAASEQLVAKGIRLGFTRQQLNSMTPQERDLIRQATSRDDVTDLVEKYPAQETEQVQEMATRPQKKQLVDDFGYNWNEVNIMTYTQAQEIIDSGLTKQDRISAEIAEAEAEEVAAEAAKEFNMRSIEQRIANSHYIAELSAIESEIAEALQLDPLAIDTDRLSNALDNRKQELAREINFEDIQENEVVIMKDNRRMVVVEKTPGKLKLRKFGETAGSMEIVYPNEVQSKILYKDQPFMETVDINPPITPEAQETSNENVRSAQNLNTTEAIEEDRNAAKVMTQQEVDDEFNNSIGCE